MKRKVMGTLAEKVFLRSILLVDDADKISIL